MATFLQRLFGSTAPVVTETRASSVPQVPRRRRSYSGAGTNAFLGNFSSSGGGSADYELSQSIYPLRNRIRSIARNSGVGKRFVQLLKDNVVGEAGFNLQVRVRMQDGKPDRSLNTRVEEAWTAFCQNPTVIDDMDMVDIQKQMVATWGRDGEYILELVRDGDDGVLLNPIESDMLDHNLTTIHGPTGNQIRMGVEVDANGRAVAYHFLHQHPGDLSWFSPTTKQRYRRVSADRVIHIFERLRPGQTRGEPPASSIIRPTKMIDGYREAETTGRRMKAAIMGFVEEGPEATAADGLDGMADRVDGEETDDPVYEIDMEPGTIKKLPRGHHFNGFDPGGAQTDYAQFEAQIKAEQSMGVSISPVSLGYETAKLSYSTHRGLVGEDRDMYRGLQSFFIRRGMRKIFAVWLFSHVSYNIDSLIPPSRLNAIMLRYKFLARGWDQIDPTKDTKAENEQLGARTTSLSRIAAKRGLSRDDLLDEIEDDERALRERGLTQSLGNGTGVQPTSGGEEDDDDDET